MLLTTYIVDKFLHKYRRTDAFMLVPEGIKYRIYLWMLDVMGSKKVPFFRQF